MKIEMKISYQDVIDNVIVSKQKNIIYKKQIISLQRKNIKNNY